MMGHLNSFSASGGRNLNKNFPKIQMPGGLNGGGGVLKLRFDWYISKSFHPATCKNIPAVVMVIRPDCHGDSRTGRPEPSIRFALQSYLGLGVTSQR